MSDHWIQTVSGRRFDILEPATHMVDPGDIAHHLGQLCRFTGACSRFYSVAEHSLLVARLVDEAGGTDEEIALALLHDAAEAYLGDVSRPLKSVGGFSEYRTLETLAMLVIMDRFGLARHIPKVVADMDAEALRIEMDALMGGERGGDWKLGPRITEGDHRIGYMTAEEGADVLMGMFDLHGIE